MTKTNPPYGSFNVDGREKPFILNSSNWTQHKHLSRLSGFHPQTSASLGLHSSARPWAGVTHKDREQTVDNMESHSALPSDRCIHCFRPINVAMKFLLVFPFVTSIIRLLKGNGKVVLCVLFCFFFFLTVKHLRTWSFQGYL